MLFEVVSVEGEAFLFSLEAMALGFAIMAAATALAWLLPRKYRF